MVTFDPELTPLAVTIADRDRAFPTLTVKQLSRLGAFGARRSTALDEVLYESGDRGVPVFVVLSGELCVVRATETKDTLIATLHAGQFSGEADIITGRNALAGLRVREPGEVIRLDREPSSVCFTATPSWVKS